jgi:drug/metabolite transporter (DMT)-like permease
MRNYLYIIAATLAMAFEYLLIKAAKDVPAYLTGIVVFASAGILLAAVAPRQKAVAGAWKRFLPGAFAVGLIGSCCNLLWINGTRLTTVANASALGRLDVVFTLLLAALIFGEKIPRRLWSFIGISLFGVALIVQFFNLDITSLGNIGDGLIVVAAFMLSLNSFIIKRLSKSLGPVRLAAFNCAMNVLVFTVLASASGDLNKIPELSGQTWLILLSCGFCSFVFFAGYYSGVRELPVWKVRMIALTAPVFTASGGFLFFGETISAQTFIGIVLVLAGAAALINPKAQTFTTKQKVILNEGIR